MAEQAATAEQMAAQAPELSRELGGGGLAFTPEAAALRRCTALDPAWFGANVWGRAASLSRSQDLGGAGFTDLLTLDDVDALVSRHGLRTPFLRVAQDGAAIDASRFTRGGGVGAAINDQVADDQLARLFIGGATIVAQGLHRTHPPLVDFAQSLSRDLGHPVQINAYITPPQSQGFSAHYDVHDVFVLQVAGDKRWVIHDPVVVHPTRTQPWTDRREAVQLAATTEPQLDVVLHPGDALYLPRGYLHAATALGGVSAHVTVGVHPWTRMHLVEQLAATFADEVALRTPLPLGVDLNDPAAVASELSATLAAMQRHLQDTGISPADMATRLRRAAGTATRAEPVGPLAQARDLAALTAKSVLRVRRGLAASVSALDGGDPIDAHDALVTTSEVSVTIRGANLETVRRLLAGDLVAAGDLAVAGHGDDDTVARTLVGQAIAVLADA